MFQDLLKAVGGKGHENAKLLEKQPNKEPGHNEVFQKNAVCQCDLTYWPANPRGYKYLLGLVDVVDRSYDAEPLRFKTGTHIVEAFKRIFERNYIKPNFKILQCDPGAEFMNNQMKEYFNNKGISIRYGRTGRSNQQGSIEYMNKVVAKVLNSKMTLNELAEGKRDIKWTDGLRILIKKLNDDYKGEEKKISHFLEDVKRWKKKPLLKVGDMVHAPLEEPRDALTSKKFHGNFKTGELRYEKEKRKIVNVLLLPNSYPRYVLEGLPKVSFSSSELQY